MAKSPLNVGTVYVTVQLSTDGENFSDYEVSVPVYANLGEMVFAPSAQS